MKKFIFIIIILVMAKDAWGYNYITRFNPFTQKPDYILSADSLSGDYVNVSGDTMTGPLLINPADGTSDPLFEVETVGAYQYGIEIGTFDLTGIPPDYGKYAYLIPKTNGLVTNLMLMGPILVGDSYSAGGGIGQALGFLQESTLQTMIITAQWDWDGLGNNRMNFNDDIYFQNDLNVGGTLTASTFNPATITIGDGSAIETVLTFNCLNYDGTITFDDSGGGGAVRWEFGDTSTVADVWIPSKLACLTSQYLYIAFLGSVDVGIDFSSYASPSDDFVAFKYTHGGSGVPDLGWMSTWTNMADPGVVASFGGYGDLTLGSNTTTTDYDVAIKMQGKDNSAVIRFDNGRDLVSIDTSVTISGDLTISGELGGCRAYLASGKQAGISASAYATAGIGGTLVMTSTKGYIAMRSGSVTGLSCNLAVTTETTPGAVTIEARVNDVVVMTCDVVTNGVAVVNGVNVQARDLDKFSASDLLTTRISYDTFVGTITGIIISEEVVYDN